MTLLAVAGVPAGAGTLGAADAGYRTADGLAVYLGVLPAEMLQGHPPMHEERSMHGGPPGGRHDYHLVVAVFEVRSGARINDAEVTAKVWGLGHVGGIRLRLERMRLADTVTYGGFATLPGSDIYTIALEIQKPGQAAPVRVDFTYRHEVR